MADFTPEQRALFEGPASALYADIAAAGLIQVADPRLSADAEVVAAFELLLDLGLVSRDASGQHYLPVDPATVQSLVVSPLGQQGAELIAESAQWAQAFNSLAHTWRRTPSLGSEPFTELRGEAIDPFIASVVADAESELLTAQPQAGRSAAALQAAAQRDIAALERGVTMRTLYQHSARRSSHTHKYVAAVTAKGAEVRTLDEFFNRLIVVDRRVAVVPGRDGPHVALAVREASMVAYLVDMFERSWERGRTFTNKESSMMRDIAAEQRAMTIRMLIEGHADPASAKRLGVSPRTYAGYVADLKDEFDCQTRFQLGYAMGRRGLSGQETLSSTADSSADPGSADSADLGSADLGSADSGDGGGDGGGGGE